MKHFKTIPIKEKEIITYFVYMVKSNANKLDIKNGCRDDTSWIDRFARKFSFNIIVSFHIEKWSNRLYVDLKTHNTMFVKV